jgi:[acyl-carrier-protein] S-malonyltransferase
MSEPSMSEPSNVGVMFPGQGTQRLGMGRHLERASAAAAAVFDIASEVLDRDMRALCFTGPSAEQTRTENAQAAVFTCNAAALAVLVEAGIEPVCALGHSVGEFNALHAAGVITLEQGLALVAARGALMGSISAPGAMLAVLGLDPKVVERLCLQASETAGASVFASLRNGPANVVASGAAAAVDALEPLAREAGAVRATRLVVSHAFHSPLMGPAVQRWAEVVADVELAEPRIPVLLNTTGRAATGLEDIRTGMVGQLTAPVLWVDNVEAAVEAGTTLFVESGDSKVLTGLARAIAPEIPAWTLSDPRTVRRLRTGSLATAV